ncbi:ATP-binding protein [Patulibacter brassicae]|uniref:ATP-binding protein n=1 Tax=Patulibacter brassicae TaxID=1705717 RepID=A0ABU4VQ12_9ACTN|nr:ATP-binding protein [Patulibacter brassicae]MDX8153437.1 ATP-binding protein [Patulibacter brassicae]
MSTFLGRTEELATLTAELDAIREDGLGRFIWVHGRRRVGKSRLVQELCSRAGVPYCFFQAPERGREAALADFVDAVSASTLPDAALVEGTSFARWDAALIAATRGATAEAPVVVVLDELPYLAAADDGFAADLQRAWDRALESLPVLLVAIGSDVRMMEELVRAHAPLHGRPTRLLRVAPLDPRTVAALVGAGDARDALERYLVVGGLPALAAAWRGARTRRDFLRDALQDDQTPFVVQAVWLLDGELASSPAARRVIETIGAGETAFTRIVQRSGVSQSGVMKALELLVDRKGLVERRSPLAVPPPGKSAKYVVADPYLRFWLRFVRPHLAEITRGLGRTVVDRIEGDWSSYAGRAIEPLVREAVERLATAGSRSILEGTAAVGGWWRRDHRDEVDLVGADAGDRPSAITFVGSVKWRTARPFDREDARALVAARQLVPGATRASLVAVSASGFGEQLGIDERFTAEDLLDAW